MDFASWWYVLRIYKPLLNRKAFVCKKFLHIITKICNPQLRYCLNNRYGQSQLLELFALYGVYLEPLPLSTANIFFVFADVFSGSIPLMEWCASLDFTDSYGSQTLYWAARGGHKHVIQWATSGKKVSEIETENDAHIATIKKEKRKQSNENLTREKQPGYTSGETNFENADANKMKDSILGREMMTVTKEKEKEMKKTKKKKEKGGE
jgi:hypothetical protein